jgi:two-component system, OmpR family, alkaline phosphatase synthesis response regulator PhoP
VKKILIADDDPPLRGLLRLVASRAGFEVDTAANGTEALEKLRANHYAVAVIDLMMPHLSGYDVIEHLAEMSARPPVVVVTALNDAQLARLDSSVVSSVLRKPFDIEMLSAVLIELSALTTEDRGGKVIDFPSAC